MSMEAKTGPNNPDVKSLAEKAADLDGVPEIDINVTVTHYLKWYSWNDSYLIAYWYLKWTSNDNWIKYT